LAIHELKEKSFVLLRDFDLFLQDPNPILIRQFKDVLEWAKTQNKTLIILGCCLCLPPKLEREITGIEFALPGKQQLAFVLDGMMAQLVPQITQCPSNPPIPPTPLFFPRQSQYQILDPGSLASGLVVRRRQWKRFRDGAGHSRLHPRSLRHPHD
jgi:hypothetical protein